MNKILVFAAILAAVYIMAFFIPARVERFSLDPEKSSELWRFLTYPFIHLDLMHLLENIAGLCLVAFIAVELKTAFSDFSGAYLSSGFLSVIPIWIILAFTALGASNAIFGVFGLISQETKKYHISSLLIFAVISIVIFLNSIISFFSYGVSEQFMVSSSQSIAHFSGFVFGIGFYFLLLKIKPIITIRKRHILRGDYA